MHVIQEISGAFEDKKDDSLNTDLKSIVVPEVIKLKLNDSIHIKDFVEGNGIYHCYISLGGNYLVKEDFTSNVIEKDILFDKPGKYKLNIGIWDIHSVAHIRYFYNIIVE